MASSDEAKGWVKIVERLGISTIYSLVAIFALWKTAGWVAPRADEFMRKHFETMDKLTTTAEKIEETEKISVEILKELSDSSDKHSQSDDNEAALTKQIHENVQAIHTDVRDIKKAVIQN